MARNINIPPSNHHKMPPLGNQDNDQETFVICVHVVTSDGVRGLYVPDVMEIYQDDQFIRFCKDDGTQIWFPYNRVMEVRVFPKDKAPDFEAMLEKPQSN